MGKGFQGNESYTLLKNIAVLEKLIRTRNDHAVADKFIEAFKAFEKVAHSCFGMTLLSTYKTDIQDFATKYEYLNLPMSTKVHVIMMHLEEFIDMRKTCNFSILFFLFFLLFDLTIKY